jgi:hypothetical protein
MSTMSTLSLFACGIIVGELMDMVYDRLNDQNIEGDSALLHWLEHYHWGLILFFLYGFPDAYALEGVPRLVSSVSSPFHLGFGLSLILDESVERPGLRGRKACRLRGIISMKAQ